MSHIVCAGGGSKLGFTAGVLSQLAAQGVKVDKFDGTSAGAISVACVAHALDFKTGAANLIKMLNAIEKNSDIYVSKDDNPLGLPVNLVADLTFGKGCGVFNNNPLRNKIYSEIPDVNPFAPVGVVRASSVTSMAQRVTHNVDGTVTASSTELAPGEKLDFKGFLGAVISSTSIEGIWDLFAGIWGDGGNLQNTPIQFALDDGATDIIVILTQPYAQYLAPWSNGPGPIWDTLMRWAEIDLQGLFWKDIQEGLNSNAALTIYAPSVSLGDPLTFDGPTIKSQILMGQTISPAFSRPAGLNLTVAETPAREGPAL